MEQKKEEKVCWVCNCELKFYETRDICMQCFREEDDAVEYEDD
ncbi:MAG: hypothetical protein Unbinned5081contig1002_34 [Prokaryotic dsDNA virus sp.]|nr:MAG: hypothetical protein Unbinned5081contig1002_34 [Prokaryotic dsDNA virus sp.]